MVFFTGPTLLVLMILSLLSAEETDYLEVRYPQKTISVSRESSANLACEAYYEFNRCGVVHVVWHKTNPDSKKSSELTDPNRYFTTINETITGRNMRLREVVTEIKRVKAEDDGRYQCKATCEAGEQAMGHFITISVQTGRFP